MAQSGYTPILIYGSGTASNIPSAANLTSTANGAELALNYADGKLYYKNSAGTITLLADKISVSVASANGFAGSVSQATATSTPAITLSTSVTGVLVGNGTAVAAAVSGTDFKTINSTSILGSGNISITSAPGGSTTQVQYNNAGAFGGSANFVFDGTNVGIGTSSPADKLDVRHAGVAARFTSTNGNNNQIAFSNSATAVVGFYMGSPAADVLQFSSSAGTERMRIDSSGNVGIGTSSPLARLTVSDSTATSGTMTLGNNASYNGTLQYIFSTGELRISQVGGASLGTTFYTASTERMRIDSSGNVGIGTTSWPSSQRLRVAGGDVAFEGQYLYLVNANADIQMGAGQNSKITNTDSTNTLAISRTGASSIITLSTAGSERMRIDSSGNVGIGVTPPTVSQGRLLSLAYSGSGISVTSGTSLDLTNNAYYNTAWKYGQTGKTARLQLSDDLFIFYNATTGTAGNNITFSERARISAAGGFSVGTTADPGAGAIYATGAITAFYSDRRLKDVKGTIANALDKVSSLSGVYYTNNEVAVAHGYTSAETQVGLLAQDVEAVLPEVVKAAPFDLDEKGNSKSGEHYKTIQYERVIPLLVEAIKELRAEIQTLRG